jgi:hypothetical protein
LKHGRLETSLDPLAAVLPAQCPIQGAGNLSPELAFQGFKIIARTLDHSKSDLP